MKKELYAHIGKKIRTFREQRKMSQGSLAKRIKVSANTISRWETGTYKPSVADLENLSRELGEPIWTFLPSSIEPPTEQLKALLSATGDLPEEDLMELQRYADFIRARRTLKGQERKKGRQQQGKADTDEST